MPSPDYPPQANQPDFVPPDAIHLTGPGLLEMTAEHFRMIERFAGDFGLRASMVVSFGESVSFEEGHEPVPVDRGDFWSFAKNHGFTKNLALSAWSTAQQVWKQDREGRYWEYEPYPHLRARGTVGRNGHLDFDAAIDLRSVRDRLIALPDPRCWRVSLRFNPRPVMFLREVVNHRFADEPIDGQP